MICGELGLTAEVSIVIVGLLMKGSGQHGRWYTETIVRTAWETTHALCLLGGSGDDEVGVVMMGV